MRKDAFERLYAAHAEQLLGFLTYRTGDEVLAEDLLADTFERALNARRRFDRRKGREKAWLYTIALNLVRDHQRRRATEERALAEAHVGSRELAASPLDDLGDRDALYRALERLSPEEREAVALRYGAEFTAPEIARFTGQPLTTVEGRVYRALRKLRDALE